MAEIVGYVAQIEGHFSATSESGSVRRLQEGDPVHQNETVDGERENAPQARLSVALDSDTVITLAAGQSQRFDSQLRPVAFSETETQTRPDTLAALLREFGPALPADAAGPSDTAPRGAAFKTASRALEAVEALLPPDSESAEALAAAAAHVAATADAVTEIRNAYAETVGADAADGAHESLATARHQLQEASRAATAALVAATELQDTLDALFSAAADADEAHPDASAAHAAARSAHDAAAAADAARRAVTRLRGAPYSDTAVLK